jgi:uncharacterized protein GlcG (DUF336 family)
MMRAARVWKGMLVGASLAAASLAPTGLWAQAPKPAAPVPVRPPYGALVTLDEAKAVAAAAEAAAKGIGATMVVTVVEPTGDLVLLQKMDGTQYSSIEIAEAKARSAARFRRPTKELEDVVGGGRVAMMGMPGVIPVAGGVLLLRGGKIIGAVGVSGGTSDQDNQVATAGAAAIR